MARVADVSFVAQIQIPIAEWTKTFDQSADGAFMFFVTLQTRSAGLAVLARESEIDDHAAAVAVLNEFFELGEQRFARAAVWINCGDVVRKGRPGRPDANPVEAVALHVVQIFGDEFI